jgi:glycosyltransferase involved in cell wall biosynthesis
MGKRKVLVMMYRESNLGGPSVAMKKLMDSSLKDKYDFVPYYFTDKLGKLPKLKSIYNLAKNIKDISPDIIYFTGLQLQGFYVAMSCAVAGYRHKTVMVVRGSSCDAINISRAFYFIFRHILEPITLRLTEITHTVCTEMSERKMLKDNMRKFGGVIYNMAPLTKKDTKAISRSELGLSEDDTVFVYTGRLIDDKGIPYLLEALSKTTHNQKLVFVGDGPHKSAYEDKCRELGISERVIFLGNRDDVIELLAASDVYVFPTLHENLSNALLEAATMRLPMIATNVGGNPEIIQDGCEGILVPLKDSEALKEAIEKLTVDKQLRAEMGKNAFAKMERIFAPEVILAEIDRIFEMIK